MARCEREPYFAVVGLAIDNNRYYSKAIVKKDVPGKEKKK